MTKTKALGQIRAGILAANRNEVAPSAPLARKAYVLRSFKLIADQTPARVRRSMVHSIRTSTY